MNILFLGDIVGKPGRNIVFKYLDELKEKYSVDFVIANGENSAHGKGITTKIYNSFINAGIDCVTLGNHSFSKQEIKETINTLDRLVRPLNFDIDPSVGKGYRVFNCKGKRIAVVNILGEVFMNDVAESPFDAMSKLLYAEHLKTKEHVDYIFVDMHAEATSEKLIFANYFKNELIAVCGTHTHVQTADEKIIDGCAFINDVGMCGPYNSIIGRDIEEMFRNMVDHQKTSFTVAEGDAVLSAVLIKVNETTNRAESIERIQIRPEGC